MAEPTEVCSICGKRFYTEGAVQACEAKGVTGTKGIAIGGRIVISGGDGSKEHRVTGYEFFAGTHEVQFVVCGADKFNIRIVEPTT